MFLGLRLSLCRKSVLASISASIGSGAFTTGATLTATVNGLEGGEVVTYQWQDDGANITGATSSTYTAAIGTDSVADASAIRCVITVDGGDPINSNSRIIRYAEGTAPAIADGQTWTVDDTAVSIDGSASGANLTFSYAMSGSSDEVTINASTGLITGTNTFATAGASGSGTATVTATDQYGTEYQDTFTWSYALRAQATGGADLDLSYEEGTPTVSQDLLANWTTNGNTLTLVSVSPSVPANMAVSSAGALSRTGTVSVTASATHTITMEDEYARETSDTFDLGITAASSDTITIESLVYNRGAAGVAPGVQGTYSSTGTTTADYTLYWASRDAADSALSKTNIENGTGDAIENGSFTAGSLASLASDVDLSTSLSSDAIDAFVRDDSGSPIESDVESVTGVTYDAVAPAFSSASVNAAGDTLTIIFDKAAYGTSIPASLTLGGVTAGTPTLGTVSGLGTTTHTIPITVNLPANGDTLTIGYNSATGDLVGIDAEVVATFSTQPVTNNVTSSFTETAVTVPDGAVLTASSTMTDAPGFFGFYSFEATADGRDAMLSWQATDGAAHRDYTGGDTYNNPRITAETTPTGDSSGATASNNVDEGDRMHVLFRGRITGGQISLDQYAWNETDAAWEAAGADDTSTSDTDINLSAANLRVFARSDNAASQNYSGDVYRVALWTFSDVADVPDPSSSTIQDLFTSGASLVDPATSQASLTDGTLQVDIYGDAADYNAGTHDGALTLTASGGTFT